MKKIISALTVFALALSLASCSGGSAPILDNSEKSTFTDFYTQGDYVYIECKLNIYSDKAQRVKISAVDNDDVETGLLKDPELTGIDKESNKETFELKAGENTVTVLFRGDYAGIFQISKRDIPRFIRIEKA